MFSVNHIACTWYKYLGTVDSLLPFLGMVGTLLESKFPAKGPTLQAGLSKDSSLRLAMLTLFCTLFKFNVILSGREVASGAALERGVGCGNKEDVKRVGLCALPPLFSLINLGFHGKFYM